MIISVRRWMLTMVAGFAASAANAGVIFAPGQWQHETNLVSADVPGIPQWLIRLMAGHGSRKSCNSASQLSGHPETLFKADDDAVCRLRKFTVSNGKLVFDTFCTNKRFPDGLLVSSLGTYTPTSYTISTNSTGTRNGKPVHIVTTGAGKHISDNCRNPKP